MKFEFHSLDELKQFIEFINADKDSIIEKEAETINKTADELRDATHKEEKK